MRKCSFWTRIFLISCALLLAFCSKEPATQTQQPAQAPATQQPAPAAQTPAQQAAPTSQPAQTAPAAGQATPGKVTGAPATEKYRLYLVNYSKTAITVSLNGDWVGQWDANNDVPLESVVQGKNQLTVELPGEPKGQLTLTVYTNRGGQNVNLLNLNFEGKTGTQTYTFFAK